MKKHPIQFIIKRIFDFLFGGILAILSLPFVVIAMLTIKICSPEYPVVFKQERVGYQNKIIIIYKLRSMTNECDIEGNLLPDEMRLKKWGKIIRKTNLDEIPQLWNILKGEMSLIGPRPLLPKEMLVMNEEEQELRQSTMPGITGWEAVNEVKTSTRRKMAEYDLYYAEHFSLWFDIRIFFMTVYIIFTYRRPTDDLRAPKIENEVIVKEKDLLTK